MTVNELAAVKGFNAVSLPEGDREISGVYIGDLLSWVMGRAKAGDAWITIMSNINIVAVAQTAGLKGVNVISTELTAFEAARLLGKELK